MPILQVQNLLQESELAQRMVDSSQNPLQYLIAIYHKTFHISRIRSNLGILRQRYMSLNTIALQYCIMVNTSILKFPHSN